MGVEGSRGTCLLKGQDRTGALLFREQIQLVLAGSMLLVSWGKHDINMRPGRGKRVEKYIQVGKRQTREQEAGEEKPRRGVWGDTER